MFVNQEALLVDFIGLLATQSEPQRDRTHLEAERVLRVDFTEVLLQR